MAPFFLSGAGGGGERKGLTDATMDAACLMSHDASGYPMVDPNCDPTYSTNMCFGFGSTLTY
jgi:hypothetical protein